jgi:hypothetical protein
MLSAFTVFTENQTSEIWYTLIFSVIFSFHDRNLPNKKSVGFLGSWSAGLDGIPSPVLEEIQK